MDRTRRLHRQVLDLSKNTLFRGSAAYSAAVLITAAGSLIFWAVAARTTTQDIVGRAAVLGSLLTFLNFPVTLPLIVVVARFGRGDERSDRVVLNIAALVAGATMAVVSLAVYVVARVVGISQLQPFMDANGVLVFILVGVGGAWSLIIEMRLLAERRYGWMLGRALIVNICAILLVTAGRMSESPLALFVASNGVVAVGAPVTWFLTQRRAPHWLAVWPLPANVGTIVRFAAVAVPSTLGGQLAFMALPVIVALSVIPSTNAQFFIAWNVTVMATIILFSVGTALLVEGDRGENLSAQARQALRLALVLALVLTIGMVAASPLIPVIYGSGFSDAAVLLRWLALGCLPLAVYSVALTCVRVQRRSRSMVGLPLLLAFVLLGPALVLIPQYSLAGAAAAWLIGTFSIGFASAFLYRRISGSQQGVPAKDVDLDWIFSGRSVDRPTSNLGRARTRDGADSADR